MNLTPKAEFGNIQSSGSNDWVPNIRYDNRWPITGHDSAINIAANLTHTRGAHTFKMGAMRERENFGQARSGTFAGEFNFSNDAANPNNAGFAYANAFLGQVTTYTESMGRRAVNPLTGEILPATYVGQMVPGSGYSCGVITPSTPCKINGIVPQENADYVKGGEGFIDPVPIQFDPRFGMAWAVGRSTNLFNSVSFNEVDTSAIFDATGRQTDTNFGKVTSARNERRMQFSLRYSF